MVSIAILNAAVALAGSDPVAWQRWSDTATAIALAAEASDPEQVAATCMGVHEPVSGLPGWTGGLAPYCRAIRELTSRSELPVLLWRRVCRDGRRAVARLDRAAGPPRARSVAHRLTAKWRADYAPSCPAVIPPRG